MSFDLDALAGAMAAQGPILRVVVAEVQGSAPREVGASMLVWATGQEGTIGGGTLELQATEVAREMLASGEVRRFARAILGPDMGQCCGGAVGLLYERYEALPAVGTRYARPVEKTAGPCPALPDRLPALVDGWFFERLGAATTPVWIWGAGHVGRAIAAVLAPLPGLAVTLVDTAPERFPDPLPEGVTRRFAPDMPAAVADAPASAHHYVLTYSHDFDFALCDALLAHGFGAAGLIGSATKRARFRSRLVQKGHAPAAIDRIRCPIGTPALGKQPAAIAVGVAHALLMELAKKEADGPVAEQGG